MKELTDDNVLKLQHRTRSRTIEYLCRAYLQFGSGAMSPGDLKKLSAAINAKAGAK